MKTYTIIKDKRTYIISSDKWCNAHGRAKELFEKDFVLYETEEINIHPDILGTLITE